jgi:hypothetical protein
MSEHPETFNLEAAINDLAGAASAMALALDGLEVICRDSTPGDYHFRGLHWLARRLQDGALQLDDELLPLNPRE